MQRVLFLYLLLSCSISLCCAQDRSWEEDYRQMLGADELDTDTWTEQYEMLCALENTPIDINSATIADLQQIPFLSETEILSIVDYVQRYHGMKTLGELSAIRGLDMQRIQLLRYFVTLSSADDTASRPFPRLRDILGKSSHQILFTGKVPLYERKGDRSGYLGYQYKHNVRYSMSYGERFKAGIVGAQDAGEPFFAGCNNMGYDYYSFYVRLKDLGRIRTLVAGRYRASFGMGLVMNGSFLMGKTMALSSLGRNAAGLREHSSTSQGSFLQGLGVTVDAGRHIDLSAFASYRYTDATLNKSDGTVSTLLKDGYHRTQTEMDKKNNTAETLAGMNVSYNHRGLHLGATAYCVSYDRSLSPDKSKVYREYYAQGSCFWNAGIDYSYTTGRFSLRGETATGGCGGVATLNTIGFRLLPQLQLLGVQRYYSKRYFSLKAQSFSEGGSVQNENGMYLGLSWTPSGSTVISAYSDVAYFVWPKYQITGSSTAWDNMVQVSHTSGPWTWYGRYRLKMKQRDNADKSALAWRDEHRGRLYCQYKTDSSHFRLQGDVAHVAWQEGSTGWMISAAGGMKVLRRLSLSGSFGYFDTADYDSRVYGSESGMLYNVSFPAFYGNGIRYWLMAHADVTGKIKLSAKLGVTDYFDRSQISSSYQQIDGSSQTDIEIQLRWKF